MTALLGGKPKIDKPIPPPQLDQALANSRQNNVQKKRGLGTTLLTGDAGLPNLGTTSRPKAYAA